MNIKEVAKLAGVSVATISRAFQTPPSPSVSARQRERILKICEELHYYPDVHSTRMNQRRSNCITLLSRHISCDQSFGAYTNHFDHNFASITMGVQRILANCNKSLQLMPLTDDFLKERRHLSMVRSKMTDGVLFWGALRDEPCVMELLGEGVPMILLTTSVPGATCPCVTADEYGGMRRVVQSALEKGHRRFAVLSPSKAGSSGLARAQAIADTLGAAGITPCYTTPEDGFGYAWGREMGEQILRASTDATCIIASDDMAAWGCAELLRENGIHVPDDISITGADGIYTPGNVHLNSFYLPSYEIGLRGAELLTQWIETGKAPEPVPPLPVDFIIGNSVREIA